MVSTNGATSRNSRLLRQNMESQGLILKQGDNAHHIVPSTHSYESAVRSRDILAKYGIDVNNFKNGIGLPDSIHSGLHTHKYMDEVYRFLQNADKTNDIDEIIDVLNMISTRVASGNFP